MEKEKINEEGLPNIEDTTPERVERVFVGSERVKEIEAAEAKELKEAKGDVESAFAKEEIGDAAVPENERSEVESKIEKEESFVKIMGVAIGKSLSWVIGSLENRVKEFDVDCFGAENLKELEGKPYILAANHIKPKNILLQMIGLSPDSFLIRRVVKEETQRIPNAISNISGKVRSIPVVGYVDRVWSPFREGVMEGAGFIPVKMKREKSTGFNRNFVNKFREAVDRSEPVIIFPQGHWDKDFNPDRKLETGAANLAKRYGLPIVPVYVNGGRTWSSREKASVSIGKAINLDDISKEEATVAVRDAIEDMQKAKMDLGDNIGNG